MKSPKLDAETDDEGTRGYFLLNRGVARDWNGRASIYKDDASV